MTEFNIFSLYMLYIYKNPKHVTLKIDHKNIIHHKYSVFVKVDMLMAYTFFKTQEMTHHRQCQNFNLIIQGS